MQILKSHKKAVLFAVLLVAVLISSLLLVQYVSKISATHVTSPTSTPSPVPTEISPTATPSPVPTEISPTPTLTPVPTSSSLYPGEVTQYQNYTLTPISVFAGDVDQHPDVAIDGTQNINQATYTLSVTGLVNKTLELSYDDIVNNFTPHLQVATLLCVEGWSVTMLWEGVSISDLLQEAGASSNATVVIFHAFDGYTTALPLDYIMQNNIVLAYKMNNATLPAFAGFPLCLVAQNQYGYKWIKWITELEVSNDTGYLGYWESRGYPNNATDSDPAAVAVSSHTAAAEILGLSTVVVIGVLAVYLSSVKVKKRYSASDQNNDGTIARFICLWRLHVNSPTLYDGQLNFSLKI